MWLKVSGETRAPSPWGGHPGGLQGHTGPGVHGREAQHHRRAGLTQGRGVQIRELGVPGLRDAMGRLEDRHRWAPRRQCLSTKTLPGEGGDPLPGARPQRRGQATRPRAPGAMAPVPGPHWLAGSIMAHSVLPHTFTAGAQVHTGRVHAPGSAGRRQAEAFARAPGEERETPRRQGSLRAPEDRGSSPLSTQAVGNASSLDIRATSVLRWPHQDPLATPQERRPGDPRGP